MTTAVVMANPFVPHVSIWFSVLVGAIVVLAAGAGPLLSWLAGPRTQRMVRALGAALAGAAIVLASYVYIGCGWCCDWWCFFI